MSRYEDVFLFGYAVLTFRKNLRITNVVASDLQSPIFLDRIGSKAFDIQLKDNTSESDAFRCLGTKMWTHFDAAV